VTIKYYRIDPGGKEEHYFTVKLEDAIIVNMEPYFPLTFAQDSDYYKHMEKVGFTYKKIIWTWEPDGIEAQDDWKEPA
jgi:type VI secretion system secreted protein Hcp